MNTLNAQDERGIFGLLKGASGTGKSVAALSFPNLFVFDYDRKMPAIALKHFPRKSIEYETFDDTDRVSDLIKEWLQCPTCGYDRTCVARLRVQCGTSCPYESLLHDSFTQMENLVIKTIADVKGESVPTMMKTMMKTKGTGKGKVDLMDFDYYKAEMRFTEWILSTSKTLWARQGNPKHILFTAHVITTDQSNLLTGLVTRTRSIVSQGNKVAAYIPTEFDEVYTFGYAEEGGLDGKASTIKYYVLTEPIGEDDSKTAYRLTRTIDFTNGNFYEIQQKLIAGQKWSDSI